MKLWAGRFQKETDTLVNDFNSSIGFDARLYKQDITGSIAHATMLGNQGIITPEDAKQIIDGLQQILAEIEGEGVEFSMDNEDIHMNIEAMLTERIGAAGKRLHTGRSRNDQVAVDTRMYVKAEIPVIIQHVLALEEVLIKKAKANLESLSRKRAQVSKAIPQPVFMRYEFIRVRLEHPVIVAVKDVVCSGCNIAVPPQSFIELQRGQQILSCPNCQRLIFWCEHFSLPEESAPVPKPVPLTD